MKFKGLLRWELERSFRFPILEFTLAILLYRVFLVMFQFSAGVSDYVGSLPTSEEVPRKLWESLIYHTGLAMVGSYIQMAVIFSTLASMLAYDFSSGCLRLQLSYPLSRSQVFAAKILTYLVATTMLILTAYLATMNLLGGGVTPPELLPSLIALIGLTIIEASYIFSIALSMSLITRNTLATFISSLLMLLGLDSAAMTYKEPLSSLIPPSSLRRAVWMLRRGSPIPLEGIITPMIVSGALLAACYLYFSRRLEV
ncbi:hypothetical protein DRO30_00895 [Candidatus Bathyarchaeota archaeon]|nr:MAG: hypothetical protein DRO30_00895 [Candidatus Bathyarchaeota archaeon]